MLIHSRSAATVRISHTSSSGRIVVREGAHGLDRLDGMAARQQVLRLELLAGARREAHAEVRQPVRPGPGPAELRGAGGRVQPADHVPVDRRGRRAEEVVVHQVRLVGPALDPHLVDRVLPVGEDADAVPARDDLVEVLAERVEGQALEHPLPHLEGRLHVQGEAGDGAERAEPDHHAVEVGVAPGELQQLPAGGHQLHRRDRGREVPVPDAGAVRRRRHGTGDRDVRQRGEVVQGQPLVVRAARPARRTSGPRRRRPSARRGRRPRRRGAPPRSAAPRARSAPWRRRCR